MPEKRKVLRTSTWAERLKCLCCGNWLVAKGHGCGIRPEISKRRVEAMQLHFISQRRAGLLEYFVNQRWQCEQRWPRVEGETVASASGQLAAQVGVALEHHHVSPSSSQTSCGEQPANTTAHHRHVVSRCHVRPIAERRDLRRPHHKQVPIATAPTAATTTSSKKNTNPIVDKTVSVA